ncbi:MAG: GNAT family N-acetyltransferase [bacterium]|nr:GNAT family N-acetyltransferase [bacterium]
MRTHIASMNEVRDWVSQSKSETVDYMFASHILLWCDEAVVAKRAGRIVGLALISPGYWERRDPEIAALYVEPEFRSRGLGTKLVRDAVRRCLKRGLVPVLVQLRSARSRSIVEALPEKLLRAVEALDLVEGEDYDEMAEREEAEIGLQMVVGV